MVHKVHKELKAEPIAEPFAYIFKLPVLDIEIPWIWKSAFVFPSF